MINVLIVEDNYEDMEYCASLLCRMNMDINIIKVGTGEKAMDALLKKNVDIAFIDIYLPDCNGLKLAKNIRKIDKYQLLNIVFVTVEVDRQLEAYKQFHCYDYIIKPFTPEQFYSAVKLLFKGVERQKREIQNDNIPKYTSIQGKDCNYLIEKDSILFVKSNGKTIDLFMTDRIIPDIKMKIVDFVVQLNEPFFMRCHKSFAVNLLRINHIKKRKNRTWDIAFFDSEEICYISRTYYKDIIEKLKDLK